MGILHIFSKIKTGILHNLLIFAILNLKYWGNESLSANYSKQKHRIAVVYERISNIRKDNLHKITRRLIDENQIIVS
ncbi:MAG: transposase, partial [Agathobacter sp.]